MNRKILSVPFLLLILLFCNQSLNCQEGWKYNKFAESKDKDGLLFTLEWGTFKDGNGYNGRVKWRFTNHTKTPVYNVSISAKVYTLSDGRKVTASGERISYEVKPGEVKFTRTDAVNTSENEGFWSDVNDNPVVYVEFKNAPIRLSVGPDEPILYWDELGKTIQSENLRDCDELLDALDDIELVKTINDYKLDKVKDFFDDDIAALIAKRSMKLSEVYLILASKPMDAFFQIIDSDPVDTPYTAFKNASNNAYEVRKQLEEDIKSYHELNDELRFIPEKFAGRIKHGLYQAKLRIATNRNQLQKELDNMNLNLEDTKIELIFERTDCRLKILEAYTGVFTEESSELLKVANSIEN